MSLMSSLSTTCLRIVLCFFVLGSAQVYKELIEEIAFFRSQTFAPSTKRTYSTHRDTYLRFCHSMNIASVPASTHGICLYAAYLARSLKFSSIKQYLGIIGLMHKEFGLTNPLIGNWQLSSPLTGVKRVHGNAPQQKLPINFDILRGIHSQLNLTYCVDAAFWAMCLVAFLVCFANHIYSLPRLEALILISSSPKPISPSFRGVPSLGCAGVKPSSLGKGWCRYP